MLAARARAADAVAEFGVRAQEHDVRRGQRRQREIIRRKGQIGADEPAERRDPEARAHRGEERKAAPASKTFAGGNARALERLQRHRPHRAGCGKEDERQRALRAPPVGRHPPVQQIGAENLTGFAPGLAADDGKVHGAAVEQRPHRGGLAERDGKPGAAGQSMAQPGEHGIEPRAERMIADPDRDGLAGLLRRQRSVVRGEKRFRPRQERGTGFGQPHEARRPVQKPAAEHCLEPLDALAHHRLHGARRLRRSHQVPVCRGSDEKANRFQVKHHSDPQWQRSSMIAFHQAWKNARLAANQTELRRCR